eukprot:15324283-Ditylum_brightwellii.AAC.1
MLFSRQAIAWTKRKRERYSEGNRIGGVSYVTIRYLQEYFFDLSLKQDRNSGWLLFLSDVAVHLLFGVPTALRGQLHAVTRLCLLFAFRFSISVGQIKEKETEKRESST